MKKGKKILCTLRTVFLLGVLLAILMTFGGCKPKEASEDEMQQALLQSSPYMDYFDPETSMVEDFTITKRQTTSENGTDVVWVSVNAKDENKSATLSYVMTYILYNDGWKLENVVRDSESTWEFEPLQGPPSEMIETDIPVDPADVTVETYLEEKRADASYTIANDIGFCIIMYAKQQTFSFNTDTGVWIPTDNRTIATQNDFSPIIGTAWQYLEDSNGARLELDSIDPVTLDATGSLQVMVVDGSYSSTKYEKILSDCVFRFEGESLIMVDYASESSDFKHLEFRHDGDGSFSVIVSPRDAFSMRRPDYYLERVG